MAVQLAYYFVVEPNRQQLLELARLVDIDKLRPVIDGKVVLRVVE